MDPTTTTAIASILTYWGGKAFEKVFDTTAGEFTKDSIKWLKSVFFEEDKPKQILDNFQEKPDSPARQNAVRAAIELELEENPQAQNWLMEISKVIHAKSANNVGVSNSRNVVTGRIDAGGNVIVGDNNISS